MTDHRVVVVSDIVRTTIFLEQCVTLDVRCYEYTLSYILKHFIEYHCEYRCKCRISLTTALPRAINFYSLHRQKMPPDYSQQTDR